MARVAWNKGLTKDTDSRVAKYATKRPPRSAEHRHALGKAWRGKKRPKETVEKIRAFMKANPNSGQFQKGQRPKNYGIRNSKHWVSRWHEEYEEAIKNKPDACEVCKTLESQMTRKLCFDHNHSTGKFRGWLCGKCNTALGNMKDSPELLKKLIEYLERTS